MSYKAERYFFVVFGSLVGAAVALLFAPQSGTKTRRQIVRYGKKAGTRAQRFVGDIGESLDHTLGDILKLSQDGLNKGKRLTESARHEILDVLDAGKKYLEDERTKLDKILK